MMEAISATAELCGHPLSPAASALLANDLAALDRKAVLAALARCRAELPRGLNIGEVLTRVEDGRPAAEDAWRMLPLSEAESVVWTKEMAQAWGKVSSRLLNTERETAHAIFVQCYTQAVLMARCTQEKITWTPSLGTDPVHREQVLLDALQKERLTADYVKDLLPYRALSLPARQVFSQLRLDIFPK
ncbi:hypothetical protein [Janthinobacterium sp. 17J80-10]|uniref:hypothetical protein n=1 Tax=Janthinobacterium sp. 17J80-10 TaxID=2497863 RepID=UPI00100563C7|nr:hypothetical protein [Janthinobacterium sp. 17J80-10]QAU34034.1 hypothetical protein EKL02_07425 [Janthinobacterium sp. 17J80-10]